MFPLAVARQGPTTKQQGLEYRPRSRGLCPRKASDEGSLWGVGAGGGGVYVGGVCCSEGVVSTSVNLGLEGCGKQD